MTETINELKELCFQEAQCPLTDDQKRQQWALMQKLGAAGIHTKIERRELGVTTESMWLYGWDDNRALIDEEYWRGKPGHTTRLEEKPHGT